MARSETRLVKERYMQVVQGAITRVGAVYELTRGLADQRLKTRVPVDTGALKSSTSARPAITPNAVGFVMRSFGNEAEGKAYARWVNGGHHTANGSWVPPNPYFSQTVRDAQDDLKDNLTGPKLYG